MNVNLHPLVKEVSAGFLCCKVTISSHSSHSALRSKLLSPAIKEIYNIVKPPQLYIWKILLVCVNILFLFKVFPPALAFIPGSGPQRLLLWYYNGGFSSLCIPLDYLEFSVRGLSLVFHLFIYLIIYLHLHGPKDAYFIQHDTAIMSFTAQIVPALITGSSFRLVSFDKTPSSIYYFWSVSLFSGTTRWSASFCIFPDLAGNHLMPQNQSFMLGALSFLLDNSVLRINMDTGYPCCYWDATISRHFQRSGLALFGFIYLA